MLFKSGLVTSASGSIGGMTASRNRGGMYLRARAIPVNPSTTAQVAARSRLSTLASRWTNILTPAQQASWNAYAVAAPTTTNALGDQIQPSGQNRYVAGNALLMQVPAPIVDDPPTNLAEPQLNVTVTSVTAGSPSSVDIDVSGPNNDWADVDGAALAVYVSRGVTPGTTFFNSPWRIAAFVDGDSTTPPTLETVFTPFNYAAGDRVFIAFRAIMPDGRYSFMHRVGFQEAI